MWFFSSATLNTIGVVWMMLLSEGFSCKYTKTSQFKDRNRGHWLPELKRVALTWLKQCELVKLSVLCKDWEWRGTIPTLKLKVLSLEKKKRRQKTKNTQNPCRHPLKVGRWLWLHLSSTSNQGRYLLHKIKPQTTEQLDFRAQTEPRLSPSKSIQPFWCWLHYQTGFLQSGTTGIY